MDIQYLPISEVKPYDRNPRFNDQAVEAVAKSITEYGFLNPIVVDADHVIICGHTRYRAALFLKLSEVPVIVADKLMPEQVKAYRIADNKTSEFATWDWDALTLEIKELQESERDLSILGFSSDVLEELLYQDQEDTIWDGETPPDYLPEMPVGAAKSKVGAIYELGEHRLLVGPRIDNSLMSTLLFDGSARLYLARVREWNNDVGVILRNGSSGLGAGGAFYVMLNDKDTLDVRQACDGCELEIHETLLWLKSHFRTDFINYQVQNDSVLYGWKPGASHKWYSDRKQTNLLQYNNAPSGEDPVALSVYLVRNSTVRGEVVLDNFSATGNTLIACEQTGRRCRLIVEDPKAADLIRCRWAEFVNGQNCNWESLTPQVNKKGKK
jgi:site-specific DNA-methyltransferase (adenine-specific)